MKTGLFLSYSQCWVFQIWWHIECSSFTESFLRIWNSSTGIPLPPVALFRVMLPKAHWTSHSTMSGSRRVITPLWLSGSWRSFLYSSSVHSCHLFLIYSASVRSIPFLSFIEPIFACNVRLVSLIFLKKSLVLVEHLVFSRPLGVFSFCYKLIQPLVLNSSPVLSYKGLQLKNCDSLREFYLWWLRNIPWALISRS